MSQSPPVPSMPGAPKAAVVLLWIGFAFGICGGLASVLSAMTLVALEQDGEIILPAAFTPVLAVSLAQIAVWTVLRAVFAVKVARRAKTGRLGAIVLESVGLAVSALSWIVLPDIEPVGAQAAANAVTPLIGAVLGAAMSATIIGLLMTGSSKDWCDQ